MVEIEAKKIECPGCGADLRYVPSKMVCGYCGYEEPLELEPYSFHFLPLHTIESADQKRKYRCPACAAQFESKSATTLCPYCKTALLGEFLNPFKPSSFLPFMVTPKEAMAKLKKHIGSLWFAPSAFKEEYRNYKSLRGYYLPKWLYNTKVQANYTGERGIYYYVDTTRYIDGRPVRTKERRVRWYFVSGVVYLDFSFVDVNARADIHPVVSGFRFLFDRAKKLDTKALSGYETKEYTLSSLEGFELAKASLHPSIEAAIRRDIGGDVQRIHSYTPHFYDTQMEQTFVPIFHTSVKWKEKEYHFFINGQNGEVVGERPYSWIKIVLFILFLASLALGAIYLADRMGYLQ